MQDGIDEAGLSWHWYAKVRLCGGMLVPDHHAANEWLQEIQSATGVYNGLVSSGMQFKFQLKAQSRCL